MKELQMQLANENVEMTINVKTKRRLTGEIQ